MRNAVPYEVDEATDEFYRPGFTDIMNELRANEELMRKLEEFALDEDGDLSKIDSYLRANAKVIWHERNSRRSLPPLPIHCGPLGESRCRYCGRKQTDNDVGRCIDAKVSYNRAKRKGVRS